VAKIKEPERRKQGISADQVIAIPPVEAQVAANPTPPRFGCHTARTEISGR
jgi:hypothetical protein